MICKLLNIKEYTQSYYKIADSQIIEFAIMFPDNTSSCNILVKPQEYIHSSRTEIGRCYVDCVSYEVVFYISTNNSEILSKTILFCA